MADRSPPTPGEWLILGGGVVGLVGSFLDFQGDVSSWGTSAFPIATLIPIYLVVMAVQIALTKFANVDLPERVMGFTWEQIHLELGFFASLMAVFWLVAAEDAQIGLFLLILSSIAALAGAFMLQKERATGAIG